MIELYTGVLLILCSSRCDSLAMTNPLLMCIVGFVGVVWHDKGGCLPLARIQQYTLCSVRLHMHEPGHPTGSTQPTTPSSGCLSLPAE